MALPFLIRKDSTCDEVAEDLWQRWKIHPLLAVKLYYMSTIFPGPLSIISGYRTCQQQEELRKTEPYVADCAVSTHTVCPALGADLYIGTSRGAATLQQKAAFGEAAFRVGLRWGGGTPLDEDGVPADWNHVDLGPRK